MVQCPSCSRQADVLVHCPRCGKTECRECKRTCKTNELVTFEDADGVEIDKPQAVEEAAAAAVLAVAPAPDTED